MEQGSETCRPFAHSDLGMKWQIVVLHPEYLCPEGQPLMIPKSPTMKSESDVVWEKWTVSEEDFTLCGPNGQQRIFVHKNLRIPNPPWYITATPSPSEVPTLRTENEALSSIAAIINADSKFRHAIAHKYPSSSSPYVSRLAMICSQVLDEFFLSSKLDIYS
ncbi:hypothetical protein AX16_000313 [Volvariella volvacea WC 439]|nr:hypothetical protein AX16_000313 [Volvariella volvacea WC 439]